MRMDPRIKELLKPEIINTVNGLELVARMIAEGFMSGTNLSKSIGIGQEFSQYRNYQPGDDLRLLDWKIFARSERYFIRQAEVETNITVKFVVDGSRSMEYREESYTKFQYARVIVAALAYLARKQGDTFGLYFTGGSNSTNIEPRFEQQQFLRLLNALVQAEPEGSFAAFDQHEHFFPGNSKEIVFFISDLYDTDAGLVKLVSRLKSRRNEVIVLHLMGETELNLSMVGSFTFEDLESGERLKVDSVEQRKKYQDKMNIWLQSVREQFLEKDIYYYLMRMNDPAEGQIRNFIRIRNSLL